MHHLGFSLVAINGATRARWSNLNAVGFLRSCVSCPSMEKLDTCSQFSLLGPPEIDRSALKPCSSHNHLHYKNNIAKQRRSLPKRDTRDPHFLFLGDLILGGSHICAVTYFNALRFSWDHDPLTTLKLICNSRRVRTGTGDREELYIAAEWLHKFHPKTLAHNIATFAEFGCLKDCLEILYRILHGPNVRRWAKRDRIMRQRQLKISAKEELRSREPREMRVMAELMRIRTEQEKARVVKKEKIIAMAKRAMEMYKYDSDYRFLHDQISDLFAKMLKSDLELLKSGKIEKISLAAKWCPSLDSSYDRSTLICESIARRIFPYASDPEFKGVEEAYYTYRVRDRLRKQVLVPLRKALQLPEVYMSAKQWDLLPYDKVGSHSMKTCKKLFLEHDRIRFLEYLQNVKREKAKKNFTTALLPHEIINLLNYEGGGEVAELKWRRLVATFSKEGKFMNSIAVCSTPLSPIWEGKFPSLSHALGLLISDLSERPWKGKYVTFGEKNRIIKIEGDDLQSRVDFLRSQKNDGICIDYCKVLDLILETAILWNLSGDEMVKRVFVFSQYGDGFSEWETNYEAISEKFERSRFPVPEIVAWKMESFHSYPIVSTTKGLLLVEGLSIHILNSFLEGDGLLSVRSVTEHTLSGEEYKKLVVLD